jgi:dipeptidyl aminopeptidase/acylaminoacyl peptidase
MDRTRGPLAIVVAALVLIMDEPSVALAQIGYGRPPKVITDVLDAPPPPAVVVTPERKHLLLVQGVRYPSVAELAAPMLRLAGLRINPQTNGPHMPPRIVGITIQSLDDGAQKQVKLPVGGHFGMPELSPNGKWFALTNTTEHGIDLWIGDIAAATIRRIDRIRLNAVMGHPVQWMPDGTTVLCQAVPPDRGPPPVAPPVPPGPVVQESHGKAGPVRTFQDLLQNPHDEALFDYYATSLNTYVDAGSGELASFGKPAVFAEVEPSPDGEFLLIEQVRRPYSYLYPVSSFPHDIEVWDQGGKRIERRNNYTIAKLPLQDRVPIEGVPTGPRNVQWVPTMPATLAWVEALDDGDPKKKVPHRDRILRLDALQQGTPRDVMKLEHRFAGFQWGENDGLVLVRDYDRDRRWSKTYAFNFDASADGRLIWDRSVQDRYRDPGTPLLRTLPNGKRVMWQYGNGIFLAGAGASPQGDRPFLDRFDLKSLKTDRLFHCGEGEYEVPFALVSDDGRSFLTRHETPNDPPNIYVRTAGNGEKRALTHFTDLTPQIRGITKRLVTYKRPDGVPLSFTLYLPPGYKPGERLPTVMWAYPLEYNTADTAGQVSGSPYRFTTLAGPSHLFFLLQGYAVLDGATMPVVGDPETANDSFLDQIVASAKAAIDTAAENGVTDPKRVGVAGHSYGAFMTANLLAHSDLFRAGIARSGAYNRTLTPFGFQSERRTLWEASDIYTKLSPFQFAHKISQPLLLIHGAADNNPGTFPMQSERMYQAIRGNGGTVRLVVLPYESHGYMARESVEHTLAEMLDWFDRYVK